VPAHLHGHREETEARARQRVEAGQVLDDRDLRREERAVRGPLATGRVVDVERVDADERGARRARDVSRSSSAPIRGDEMPG